MPNYDYIVGTGVIVPDTSTLRDDVIAEYKQALGDDLVTTPDTPEGMLITAEVLARDAVIRNNANLANQINPNIAGGVFLDAIWALLGGEREVSTRSTATVTVTGSNGTIISTSVRFKSAAGDLWGVLVGTSISVDNTAQVLVRAIEYGPIPAPSGSINQIVVGAIGLETVTNDDPAVLGKVSQSDFSVRSLRKKTLAIQGVGLPKSIISALYSVEGVNSLTFRENVSSSIAVIDGVTMSPHSIYACVDGGLDEDVAFAMLRKSLGSNFNGLTVVSVVDPSSSQLYNVRFDRPTAIPILMRINVRVTNPLINPQTAVRQAIINYTSGNVEGEDGFVVGGNVSSFELAGAISVQYPNIFTVKFEIALASDGIFQTDEIPIAIFEKATVTESSITVISV